MSAIEAPAGHPNVNRWWDALRRQSWLCYLILGAEIPAVLVMGVTEHAAMPLVIANVGLVVGAASYGGGTTLVDTVKAWRGNT